LLAPTINQGITASKEDAKKAQAMGFERHPRIRFGHIGDMAATPSFTNRLGAEIAKVDSEVKCVVYTRRREAPLLNPKYFVVNFTLDGSENVRKIWAPKGARIVASSWDGHLTESADVNFLEHHVEKCADQSGNGFACPVTANHGEVRSCDDARCDRCFNRPTY